MKDGGILDTEAVIKRFRLQVCVQDESGTISLTLFNDEVQTLVDRSAYLVISTDRFLHMLKGYLMTSRTKPMANGNSCHNEIERKEKLEFHVKETILIIINTWQETFRGAKARPAPVSTNLEMQGRSSLYANIIENRTDSTGSFAKAEFSSLRKWADSTKKYSELIEAQQLQDKYDVQATNIIFHGLPPDVYALVNHQEAAKYILDRVKLLMQGTQLSYQERECKLYNLFDKFASVQGEKLYEYYWRFSQLINDMHTIG
nr:replication protein A 70 kDa DNA-binding subunit B [Tanacetum cinerariifolium]